MQLTVAIVGMGPRGLSVLERLVLRLRQNPVPAGVVIWAVDPVEHGPGRVWRTSQPPWLAMNATAGEVTVQSPDSDLPPAAFAQWAAAPALAYPTRAEYGDYLRDTFRRLCAAAPSGVRVRPVLGDATGLRRLYGRLLLTVGGRQLPVDKVVLATGHPRVEPTPDQRAFQRLADRHPSCTYIGPDVAADMPLDDVPDGSTVAVRGLGLTFYDVVRSLSLGRGGRFLRDGSGRLRYRRSGREPTVVAGSRGGLPFLGRARMTEPPQTAPSPVILTDERLDALRAAARARRGTAKLDFAAEVEPVIAAEVEFAYYICAARLGGGEEAAERFAAAFLPTLDELGHPTARTSDVLRRHGLDHLAPIRLDGLARPFRGEAFPSPAVFRRRLLAVLRADVSQSRKGPLGSPLKAGLEVLRQLRPLLPSVVDFGALLPASHRDFLERFEPMSYVLSAGPPDDHVEQLVALIDAGVLEVVGPEARFTAEEAADRFAVESPQVTRSRREASVLIEARVPTTDITRDTSPLMGQLLADGMVSQYVNGDGANGGRFATGGLAVTPAPFHVVDGEGQPDPDVYAIGVAADRTRWFTQVGTGRPGKDSPFCRDADALALDILASVPALPA